MSIYWKLEVCFASSFKSLFFNKYFFKLNSLDATVSIRLTLAAPLLWGSLGIYRYPRLPPKWKKYHRGISTRYKFSLGEISILNSRSHQHDIDKCPGCPFQTHFYNILIIRFGYQTDTKLLCANEDPDPNWNCHEMVCKIKFINNHLNIKRIHICHKWKWHNS